MSIASLTFSGMTNPIVNGPFGALLQDVVAPELPGRASTVLGSMTALAVPLGLAIGGPLSDWLSG
jgi:DHA3 family macrolide efflux protein-like MFS transporter